METMPMLGRDPNFVPDPEKFKQKSKVECWAKRGLGKKTTAVEGFVEMLSAVLCREGVEVPPTELERWLDCYYQLRYEAEKEADMAKFVAEGCKVDGRLEPIRPRTKAAKGADMLRDWPSFIAAARDENKWKELTAALAVYGLFSLPFGPKFCGPEVRDKDEKKEEKNNG